MVLLGILAFGVKPHYHPSCIRYLKKTEDLGFIALSRNFTYIELIVNQRWARIGVPREKPPDLLVRNLASQCIYSKALTTVVRDPLFKSQGYVY